jgi:hypothetical protein
MDATTRSLLSKSFWIKNAIASGVRVAGDRYVMVYPAGGARKQIQVEIIV